MPTTFEVLGRDGAGRRGRFGTRHGAVETPTLLPVLNPNLPLLSAREMRAKFGCRMVITNSYIIWKKRELRERALAEGVHALLDWDGPVMTDSGTFQMYVYGRVEVGPEEIVAFQRDIGVDVGTILDVFSTPDRTRAEAEADLAETLERAGRAAPIKGDMALAATVQGGVYPELRTRCAESYRALAADFHPIGGVVPLMEGQRYRDLVDVIVAAKQGLDPSRPVHLFGAGHPLVFPMAALLGCDFFDSSAYAKYAKDGRMMFEDGTADLGDLTELPCDCPICAPRSAEDLRKAPEAERMRLLAEHNLHVSFRELRRVREAIRQGSLWELVEMRARAHPALLDALKRIVDHAPWIETLEPLSKRTAFFYSGPESARRPEVLRYRQRLLSRYDLRGRDLLIFPNARRPYSQTYGSLLPRLADIPVAPAAVNVLGPVPFDLDEVYPLAQSAEPTALDPEARAGVERTLEELAKRDGAQVLDYGRLANPVEATFPGRLPQPRDWDRERVAAVADYQFGPGAGAALLEGGTLRVEKSRNTGKIRTVHVGAEHVLSMRAEDGLFTLKLAGARRLHRAFEFPRLRVVVEADSVPFNRDGKSVFAKFVSKWDATLRAGDETLVVDWSDRLVAVGQLLLAPAELGFFKSGAAVSVREGNREAP